MPKGAVPAQAFCQFSSPSVPPRVALPEAVFEGITEPKRHCTPHSWANWMSKVITTCHDPTSPLRSPYTRDSVVPHFLEPLLLDRSSVCFCFLKLLPTNLQ